MVTRYLLDTNIASFAIKDNMSGVRRRLHRVSIEDAAISVVTEAELRFGLALQPEATRLKVYVEEFLRIIEILPWNSKAAIHYAHERAALEKAGLMDDLDMMIAAQALAENLTLVTNDSAFHRIKRLRIEDWTRS